MITDLILLILWLLPKALLELLPSGSIIPPDVNEAIVVVVQNALTINEFFPVTVVLSCFGVVLAVEGIILLIKLFQLVLGVARGYKATK